MCREDLFQSASSESSSDFTWCCESCINSAFF
ncbi:ST-I family heat-stable enterotoxin [Legionella anisa]